MTSIEQKTGISDAECEQWDDYYTKNTFEPGPNLLKQGVKPGFAQHVLFLNELDRDVAEFLRFKVQSSNMSQTRVINDIVREKIAFGV
jgi:hypothetical protein